MKIYRLLTILTLITLISCHSTVDIIDADNYLKDSVITEKEATTKSHYIYKNGSLNT